MSAAITQWHHDATNKRSQFMAGYFIGSEGANGEHIRSATEGGPFTIYIKAREIGATDRVICGGIDRIEDAARICYLLNQHYTFGED